MDDLNRRRRPGHRVLAVAVALMAMMAFVVMATPASAADPTTAENFGPDGTGTPPGPPANATDDTVKSIVSDKADGLNSRFHLTTVTSQDVSLVQWYICPTAFPNAQVDTGADLATEDPTIGSNNCSTSSAEDTTGAVPPGLTGAAATAAGEAYEADIDFFVSGDPAARDLVAWVCTATPATDANCDAEVEPDVQFDDGATTPASASSAGEITAPVHPANISNQGFTASASTSPDVTGVTFCLALLDETSALSAADETNDPTDCITDSDFTGLGTVGTIKSDVTANNPAAQQSISKTWSIDYSAAEVPDGLEMALILFEGTDTDGDPVTGMPATASGAGVCATGAVDCQLDSHYVVSAAPVAASVKIAFPDEGATASLPNNCTEAEQVAAAESAPEQYNRVQGCVLDQSGNNVTDTVHWAFQAGPADTANSATDETGFECLNPGPAGTCSDGSFPSASNNSGEHQVTFGVAPATVGWPNYECNGIEASPGAPVDPLGDPCPTGSVGADGVQRDAGADRFYEIADGDPGQTSGGTAGIADEVLDLHTGGTYPVIFCVDANDDAATSATPCSGEAIQATGNQFIQPVVDHLHVKQADQTDALCHTGSTSTTAPEGSVITLRGCAITKLGTAEKEAPNIRVLWVLNPTTPGDPGTLLSPINLTDPQGHATVQVSSGTEAAKKSTTVRLCMDIYPESTTSGGQDGNGTCDAAEAASGAEPDTQVDFKIDWTALDQVKICDSLRDGAGANEIIVGTAGKDKLCGFGGNDTLRGLGGNDTLKGGGGKDTHSGGAGKDTVQGGPGTDTMKGGSGNDTLKGGGGKDTAKGGGGDDSCKSEVAKGCE